MVTRTLFNFSIVEALRAKDIAGAGTAATTANTDFPSLMEFAAGTPSWGVAEAFTWGALASLSLQLRHEEPEPFKVRDLGGLFLRWIEDHPLDHLGLHYNPVDESFRECFLCHTHIGARHIEIMASLLCQFD